MENTLSWTIPNLITVTLMVALSFFAFAFVSKMVMQAQAAAA